MTLGAAVTAVAAGLRAGLTPPAAWRQVTGCPTGPDGVPGVDDLVRACGAPRPRTQRFVDAWRRAVRAGRPGPPTDGQRRAAAVVAAGRLATELGAPLAPVLDRVAESIAADDEVDGERRAALAGPRATAALLGWLPLLGTALGVAVGADPVGVVLAGGAGTASAVVGLVLLVVGRCWTARLLGVAAGAGAEGSDRRPGGQPEGTG